MINFGLPYQGSKSKIAADLIRIIPPGQRFVDVFAGGCAMTHAAFLARKWRGILANDVVETPRLFLDAASGKYKDETRWISREDFAALKDKDLYVRMSWSFGNNGVCYLYSQEIEPYKKACHYAVVFDDWSDMKRLCPETWGAAYRALKGKTNLRQRRLAFGPAIVRALKERRDASLLDSNPLYRSIHKGTHPDGTYLQSLQSLQSLERLERLQSLESLQSLERLERLQSLERLERLQSLEVRTGDYRGIEIKPGDIVYCDPPYKNTAGYNKSDFDHEAFYDWVEHLSVPVYISEYSMPDDRFMCIWKKKTNQRLSQNGSSYAEERLYVKRYKGPGKPAN